MSDGTEDGGWSVLQRSSRLKAAGAQRLPCKGRKCGGGRGGGSCARLSQQNSTQHACCHPKARARLCVQDRKRAYDCSSILPKQLPPSSPLAPAHPSPRRGWARVRRTPRGSVGRSCRPGAGARRPTACVARAVGSGGSGRVADVGRQRKGCSFGRTAQPNSAGAARPASGPLDALKPGGWLCGRPRNLPVLQTPTLVAMAAGRATPSSHSRCLVNLPA